MAGIGYGKRFRPPVAIVAATLAAAACALCLWNARSPRLIDPLSRAAHAYDQGEWANAADLTREALKVHKDDPAALRLMARARARVGRDDAAIAIYERRLDPKALEAEDHLVLGMIHDRHGQTDAAARDWNQVARASNKAPRSLDELAHLHIQGGRWGDAMLAAERLSRSPGWEAHGSMMLGTVRSRLNNIHGAALSFRRALLVDSAEVDKSHDPTQLRKLIARTLLRVGRPAEAETMLRPILDRKPDPEAWWLLSRVYLQKWDKVRGLEAMKRAGSYRADNPLQPEPSPYVGEARCEKCHAAIFRDSLASRHTQTYFRGTQLDTLPLPDRPLPDPDDPKVTHTFRRRDGALTEETRVGNEVFGAIIEYAFGTSDRYLTMVSRDSGGACHIAGCRITTLPRAKGGIAHRWTGPIHHKQSRSSFGEKRSAC